VNDGIFLIGHHDEGRYQQISEQIINSEAKEKECNE
jgi:hypothetical protein